jgi:hypothetical protein
MGAYLEIASSSSERVSPDAIVIGEAILVVQESKINEAE